MLNIFYHWAEKTIPRLPAGVDAQLTRGAESDNRAARIDFDTPASMGRITCWNSGNFYAEIVDGRSGRTILARHGKVDSAAALSDLLRTFLAQLQSSRGSSNAM
nr:hypothetical protein [uncultured Duganella sp.]